VAGAEEGAAHLVKISATGQYYCSHIGVNKRYVTGRWNVLAKVEKDISAEKGLVDTS
jgi:hypothetical protein